MAGLDLDVVVVGDGPAGLALAAQCRSRGLEVATLGPDRAWTATYATWVDDVDLPSGCFATTSPAVVVHARRRHVLERPYAVLDNDALRRHLGADLEHVTGTATSVQHFDWGTRVHTEATRLDARIVVDASGRVGRSWAGQRAEPAAWQTAYGVVLDEPPARFDDDLPTFMDLRSTVDGNDLSTFCYVVPLADGWLVEETVLAARPAVEPAWLAARLEARVGDHPPPRRVETVAIPMGGRVPRGTVLTFGAAAGYTNPVTGYSVAASLRAAPRVADAIVDALGSLRPDPRPIHEAVWPSAQRLTRRLHDHGLRVLLRLTPGEVADFFEAFFGLPVELWSAYLRIDAPPKQVSRAMVAVLRRLPWRVRRRVLATPPWSARPACPGSSA